MPLEFMCFSCLFYYVSRIDYDAMWVRAGFDKYSIWLRLGFDSDVIQLSLGLVLFSKFWTVI